MMLEIDVNGSLNRRPRHLDDGGLRVSEEKQASKVLHINVSENVACDDFLT